MDLKETYNRIAEDWHRDHQNDGWWVEGTDRFVSFLKQGDKVLDVGCGSGVKSKYLLEKGLQVVGIDFSEKMIDIARREVPSANFLTLDMREVGTLTGDFDGIFAQAALLHIPKKEIDFVLRKLADKLKERGYLYLAVKGIKNGGVEEEVASENDYGYSYERFFSYFDEKELLGALQKLNLEIVFSETKSTGSTNWIQIIAKK